MDLIKLWSKPISYKFTEREIAFIKKHNPKHQYKVKYAFYNKKSSKGLYLAFIIDSAAHSPRRSGIENYWTYIAERPLTNIEYQEMIENFGSNNRRFLVFYYRDIEYLMLEDKKYNVETPEEYVKLAKAKGYSGDFQLKIEF